MLPGRLGNSVTNDDEKYVPDDTFSGCKNLECVEFPDGAYDAKYHSDKLFAGVLNSNFYVRDQRQARAAAASHHREAVHGMRFRDISPRMASRVLFRMYLRMRMARNTWKLVSVRRTGMTISQE